MNEGLSEFLRYQDVKKDPDGPVYGQPLRHYRKLPMRLATPEEYAKGGCVGHVLGGGKPEGR